MKKGQMILGAVALVVTAVGSFAFKTQKKVSGNQLYTKGTTAGCRAISCYTTGNSSTGLGCGLAASYTVYTAASACSGTKWTGSRTTNTQ